METEAKTPAVESLQQSSTIVTSSGAAVSSRVVSEFSCKVFVSRRGSQDEVCWLLLVSGSCGCPGEHFIFCDRLIV